MKTLYESIIGRKGIQFSPKDNIQIGDILVQRNGMCWYLQDDMMLTYYSRDDKYDVHIGDFLMTFDDMLMDISGDKSHDVVNIYRSGNSIRNPNYKKIERFINHSSPIWKS